MKLYCDGLDLSDAALKVSKALSGKSIYPILEGIKLTAKEDSLTLFATDTSLSIEKTIKADIIEEGEVVIIGKTFVDFVKKLEGETVELSEFQDGQLSIKYADSNTKMNIFPVEDYPSIQKDIGEGYITMKTSDFKEIIENTVFACIQDDSRPVLKGCCFETSGDTISSVAVDGYRMAIDKKPLLGKSADIKAIIPSRTLNEVCKLLDNSDEITIFIEKNNIMIDMGSTKLYSNLIEGQFIDYNRIIPQKFDTHIVINKQLFVNSIERASIVARSTKNNLAGYDLVKFDIKDDYLTLSSSSEEGDVKENIPITLAGKDIFIGFSCKRILDYLRCVNEDFITIDLISPREPCIIRPNGNENYFYLLLPMTIQQN